MKKSIIIVITVILVILSCKKKADRQSTDNSDTAYSTAASTTGGTTGSGATTGGTISISTSSAQSFHGFLSDFNTYYSVNGQITKAKTANANFYPTALKTPSYNDPRIRVKKVSLNGDSITWKYGAYSGTQVNNVNGGKWEVQGANGIPSFTFDPPFSEPGCSNLAQIPDSISKSSSFNISLTVSNAEIANLILYDNINNISVVEKMTIGINNITISPSDLEVFSNSFRIVLYVDVRMHKNFSIGGKDFTFDKTLFFSKPLALKD